MSQSQVPAVQVSSQSSLYLPKLTYKGVPVVTTETLAMAYEVEAYQLRQNFKNNKERFVEGKHFYSISGNELKEFKNSVENFYSVQIDKRTPNLTLWTERGAARHAKMLSSNKAWEVFELMEETFFRVATQTSPSYPALPDFTNPAIAARAWAEQYEARERAEAERDEAVRTKSQIVKGRDAKVMGMVGGLTTANKRLKKENGELKEENGELKDRLGIGKTYKRLKAIEWFFDIFRKNLSEGDWKAIGRWFSEFCRAIGFPPVPSPDSEHGKVNTYHSDAIAECHDYLKKHPAILSQYRIDNAPKIIPLYALV